MATTVFNESLRPLNMHEQGKNVVSGSLLCSELYGRRIIDCKSDEVAVIIIAKSLFSFSRYKYTHLFLLAALSLNAYHNACEFFAEL